MANKVLNGRDCAIRIYDETSGTPLYMATTFIADMTLPVGRTRPEEVLQISQGKAITATVHHIINTDAALFAPVELTIAGKLYTTDFVDDLLDALSNPWDDGTWQPGGTSTFVGVTTLGSIVNANGTSVTFPPPVDAHRAASLVNVELLWDLDTDWGLKYQGVYFEPSGIEITKGDESESEFSATGTVYGAITQIAAFTTGTEIT